MEDIQAARPTAMIEVLSADGWLSTGDMGFLADGFLTITDRKKDLIKTSGGKYIAPLPIEARLQAERAVKAVLVVGNERPSAAALIVPDWDAVRSQLGIAGMPAELKKDPRVRGLFQELVDQCNRDLASFESIKRFALLERDFAENLDERTPTLKPKRKVIGEHFAAEIEALYSASRLHSAPPPATAGHRRLADAYSPSGRSSGRLGDEWHMPQSTAGARVGPCS